MSETPPLLYLSRGDIEALAIGPREVEAAVEDAFRAKAAGKASLVPKLALHPAGGGAFFHAMPGALQPPRLAGVKWVSVAPAAPGRALPSVLALVILNDLESGAPVAIMDGTWLTGLRTAAVSVVAARRLARAEARTIGFVGCGVQARTHLAALRAHFPVAEVVAYSRRSATAEAFAREAAAPGLAARVTDDPREAVAGLDIVVTSVPPTPGPLGVLDPDWLAPGAFAALVDLGRSWRAEGIARIDRLVTDDRPHYAAAAARTRLPYAGPFHAELGELVAGTASGRRSAQERAMFFSTGIALADIAVAALIAARARARGVGTALPW
ncbi:MAG TPA: ornithine cyclodeaminase family protein [Alphaproteobacteria bacterium]|nr:ornithine cyclodeaminase family protein [Alphaproteobacteria bacterium]